MMDLESLLKLWETDSKIDDVNLDDKVLTARSCIVNILSYILTLN